jgi:hypothetical protein
VHGCMGWIKPIWTASENDLSAFFFFRLARSLRILHSSAFKALKAGLILAVDFRSREERRGGVYEEILADNPAWLVLFILWELTS